MHTTRQKIHNKINDSFHTKWYCSWSSFVYKNITYESLINGKVGKLKKNHGYTKNKVKISKWKKITRCSNSNQVLSGRPSQPLQPSLMQLKQVEMFWSVKRYFQLYAKVTPIKIDIRYNYMIWNLCISHSNAIKNKYRNVKECQL